MRELLQGSKTWVEVTDNDWRSELSNIHDALRSISKQLRAIEGVLIDIYWRGSRQIYIEGTNKTIKVEEE